jgi:hypothetical protein
MRSKEEILMCIILNKEILMRNKEEILMRNKEILMCSK